jgi:glucose/arabinose dehydrogenase
VNACVKTLLTFFVVSRYRYKQWHHTLLAVYSYTVDSMSTSLCTSSKLEDAVLAPGFCAGTLPVTVDQPRSIRNVKVPVQQAQAPEAVTTNNTTTSSLTDTVDVLLVLERGSSSVIALEEGEDGVWSRRSIASTGGLNHGLEFTKGSTGTTVGKNNGHYLYVSSSTTVFCWKINLENNTITATAPERVIINMNADGQGGAPSGHRTRTLAYDVPNNRLYVSVGSGGNVDPNSFRSRIRRFDLSDDATLPLDFETGFVFADGLRNEVGLAFDRHGILWGVENSADQLSRSDLGGRDLTENNPAEELNRFPVDDATAGSHYGYPYCWTAYRLPDDATASIPDSSQSQTSGRGTVWAWPSFLSDGVVTDDMCRSTEAYVPPAVAMQAHSAPLGITFYQWTDPETRPDHCANVIAFPVAMDGFAFIAFHGSWNRDIPTGYKVVYVPMDENGNVIQSDNDNDGLDDYPVVDLLAHTAPNAQWEDGFRPVDVEFDSCGRLLVSSDGSRRNGVFGGSKIVRIECTSVNFTKANTTTDTDLPGSGSGASFRAVSSQSVLVNLVLVFILGFRMLLFR